VDTTHKEPPTNAERARAALPFFTKTLDPAFQQREFRTATDGMSTDELLTLIANLKAFAELADRLTHVLLLRALQRGADNPGEFVEALRSASEEGR
jgi:hypothetical protein